MLVPIIQAAARVCLRLPLRWTAITVVLHPVGSLLKLTDTATDKKDQNKIGDSIGGSERLYTTRQFFGDFNAEIEKTTKMLVAPLEFSNESLRLFYDTKHIFWSENNILGYFCYLTMVKSVFRRVSYRLRISNCKLMRVRKIILYKA